MHRSSFSRNTVAALGLLAVALSGSACRKKTVRPVPSTPTVAVAPEEAPRPAAPAARRRLPDLLLSNQDAPPSSLAAPPAVRPPLRAVESVAESRFTPITSGRREPLWKMRAKNY